MQHWIMQLKNCIVKNTRKSIYIDNIDVSPRPDVFHRLVAEMHS